MTMSNTSFIKNRSIMITMKLVLLTRGTKTILNALLWLCNYVFENEHYSNCQCIHQTACAILLDKGTAYYFTLLLRIW